MKKVLIVDDEPEIVELLSMALGGALSTLAARGGEALQAVREHRPDVVLTDAAMPTLDGRELCRAIKADPETRDTRVILMMSPFSGDAAGCGADRLVSKPFDVHSLAQTVYACL